MICNLSHLDVALAKDTSWYSSAVRQPIHAGVAAAFVFTLSCQRRPLERGFGFQTCKLDIKTKQ
jgi:hypothetical protein